MAVGCFHCCCGVIDSFDCLIYANIGPINCGTISLRKDEGRLPYPTTRPPPHTSPIHTPPNSQRCHKPCPPPPPHLRQLPPPNPALSFQYVSVRIPQLLKTQPKRRCRSETTRLTPTLAETGIERLYSIADTQKGRLRRHVELPTTHSGLSTRPHRRDHLAPQHLRHPKA